MGSEMCIRDSIVHDYANFGTWTERGSKEASTRATKVWKDIVNSDNALQVDGDRLEALQSYIARRTEEGGAFPES